MAEAASGSNFTATKQAIMKAKMQAEGKQPTRKTKKNKKEKAYYHVSINKLQHAFEQQFFS